VRELHVNSCSYWQLFFIQNRMDFTEISCVCALALRRRKDRLKKRHLLHPLVSKRLLNRKFYKLYEDLRNCRGKFFNYFRMSIERFNKLLCLLGHKLLTTILDYAYNESRGTLSADVALACTWRVGYSRFLLEHQSSSLLSFVRFSYLLICSFSSENILF
jgi:hypothetical protein